MIKKLRILGVAGIVLAGGIAVAGCAETSSATSGVPNDAAVASDESGYETDGSFGETSFDETMEVTSEDVADASFEEATSEDATDASFEEEVNFEDEVTESDVGSTASSDAYDIDVKEVDGKYVYTILDGRVQVPLNTRIEDYIGTWGERGYTKYIDPRNTCFDINALTNDLGWKKASDYYGRYDRYDDSGVYIAVTSLGGRRDSPSGASASMGFYVSLDHEGTEHVMFYRDDYPTSYLDRCVYETNMDGAISYDHAVLLTYIFENAPISSMKSPYLLDMLSRTNLKNPYNLFDLYEY